MKRLFKQIIACVVVVSMLAAMGITAFAHKEMDNMVFAGYNTVNPQDPYKVYNEVMNGEYTGKQVMVPVKPTWSAAGYEMVYPYAGYSQMYLEGNKQDVIMYNDLFPQWETRRRDWMWELKAPHYIWERQQTKVNNETWTWDFGNEAFGISDDVVKTKTARPAYVIDTGYEYYGFGPFNKDYEKLNDMEEALYSSFIVTLPALEQNVPGKVVTETTSVKEAVDKRWNAFIAEYDSNYVKANAYKLGVCDANGKYDISDADIQAMIPVVYTQYVEAQFTEDSDKGYAKKVVADEYMKYWNDGWTEWDVHTGLAVAFDANIRWTTPTYEQAYPYLQYQFLVVNQYVFDGRDEDGDGIPDRAKIMRYTGGKVLPEVEWKIEFYEQAIDNGVEIPFLKHAVYRKYVDGKPAFDRDNQPIYIVPGRDIGTEYYPQYNGNIYFVANENTLEVWGKDKNNGETRLLSVVENWTGAMRTELKAYFSGSILYDGTTEPQQTHDFWYENNDWYLAY